MKNKGKRDGKVFLLMITIALFVTMYIAGIIIFNGKGFAKPQVFLNLFISNAGLIVIAAGMTMVMITGGIDISVGSVVALTCMMLAWMMEVKGIGAVPALLTVLAMGIFFGLVQGFFIAYLKIQPFIVTLAGMFFARGMTAIISQEMISVKNELFLKWAKSKINLTFLGGTVNKKGVVNYPFLYPSVIIALAVLALVFVVLKYTKFGRTIYAVGGNEQSALMMGLNVKRTKLFVYVINGFLCALGGFLFCLNTCAGFVEQAKGFEMEAIASAVIGGTLLSGGVGNVFGSL
ncbi:MAG: ABC transporter permease subunit, partial [Lacrimispora sphenoides]